jgi:hypothetical protein
MGNRCFRTWQIGSSGKFAPVGGEFKLRLATRRDHSSELAICNIQGSTAELSRVRLFRRAWPRPTIDGRGKHCRTTRSTTPNYQVQTVYYPWHPFHDQQVSVVRLFAKRGVELCRCRPLDQVESRYLELPAWMLDRARCLTMRLESQPHVSWQALVTLKQLIAATQSSSVVGPGLSAQVEVNTQPGDDDVPIQTLASPQTAHAVRSRSESPEVGGPVSLPEIPSTRIC